MSDDDDKNNDTYISDEDLEFINKRLNEQYFESRFQFLDEHKGIRNGYLHLLIGTTGSGKSTLTRSIIEDCAVDHRVLVWASEESKRDYVRALNSKNRKRNVMNNITVISELDIPERVKTDVHNFMFYFREEIMKHSPEIVFIDNVTTSFMYSDIIGFKGQAQIADKLRSFAADNFLPIFCVAHTKKTIADNMLIDISDIRGSSALSNTAAYAYTLQVFKREGNWASVITIQKSRNHQIKNYHFKLFFENGTFTKAAAIPMSIVNQLYQLRDRLTDAKPTLRLIKGNDNSIKK